MEADERAGVHGDGARGSLAVADWLWLGFNGGGAGTPTNSEV